MIYNNKTLLNDKIKQYQSIDHHKIMKYPIKERVQIISSIFRNSKREDMYVQKKKSMNIFRIIEKVLVAVVSLRSLKINITKRPGNIVFVIFYIILLIDFIVLYFVIM